MAETLTAPALEVHQLAKCCWCGSAFVRGLVKVLDLSPWTCPQEACWRRQVAHAQIYDLKSGPRKGRRCRFVPLPRQVEAIEAFKARSGPTYIMIGGAAGGSKSKGLREVAHEACMTTPQFRVLLLRRTFKELESNHILDAQIEAPEMGAECIPSAKVVRYQNGSTLQFGHCETAADAANYLSSEYDLIIFDELVTFEEVQFLLISSRARSTKPGIVPKVMAGTNPGGPQAHWVRMRFIDKNVDRDQYPDYDPDELLFIPSKLEDNPYLDRNYERKLLSLPPEMRKAYRDGDWDIFPGQYFPEWRKAKHVAKLEIPASAVWYRAIDGGFVKPGAVLWIACWDGHAYLRHEWNPVRVLNSDQAKSVKSMTKEFGIARVRQSVADTSLWTPEKDTGESAAETFARHGVPLIQADKERVNGWKRLREWLNEAPDGKPWLMVHPDCTYFIRTLPSLISDTTKPEDVDTDGEDHSADALRYWVMSRPSPEVAKPAPAVPTGSPAWIMQQLRHAADKRRGFGKVA
jgi:phage terminase large subunit